MMLIKGNARPSLLLYLGGAPMPLLRHIKGDSTWSRDSGSCPRHSSQIGTRMLNVDRIRALTDGARFATLMMVGSVKSTKGTHNFG